jgi:hypothetical protein
LSHSGTTSPFGPAKQTAAYRAALAAVILLGFLIVIALGGLAAGFVTHVGSRTRDLGAPAAVQFTLPPGMEIQSADVSGDRLVLRLSGRTGEEIDIVDIGTGHFVARLRSAPPRK